ncbi:MAG: hypothetical protein K1X74_05325 [Pirellulales bacterium]|nr:hypothetical protein [Pirellulales bacterium]
MAVLYSVCAIVGGTVLIAQFAMTLLGLGDGDHSIDGDAGLDVDHDLSTDGSHDVEHHTHGASWFFGVVTFRTLVAAVTFFGLAGLAAQANALEPASVLVVALAAGAAAMYGVHRLMRLFADLRADGTVRVSDAVGQTGTVYVRIPADRRGQGKIQLNLQNQTIELTAVTAASRELPTGATIVVTSVIGPETVEVSPAA